MHRSVTTLSTNALRAGAVAELLRRLGQVAAGDASTAELANLLVAPLRREDAQRGNDLIPTLRAYYACGARVDRTAEVLFLHRNSVRYRLDRIRSLTGLDIDQPDVIAALTVALECSERAEKDQRHAG